MRERRAFLCLKCQDEFEKGKRYATTRKFQAPDTPEPICNEQGHGKMYRLSNNPSSATQRRKMK